MQSESGLSFLARLHPRPSGSSCLGPGLPPLTSQLTRLECQGAHLDHQDVIVAAVTDITGRLTHQLEASVVLLDCSHKFNIKTLARLLEDKVKAEVEAEDRRLKDSGVEREERKERRVRSAEQWETVKTALSRLFIIHIHTPDSLEMAILNLENILAENTNISAVIILGVNAFYYQVHTDEEISYVKYMKRLHTMLTEACSVHKDTVKILAVELNIFGDKADSEEDKITHNKPSSVVIENSASGLSVHFQGHSVPFSFDQNNMITWNEIACLAQS